MTRKPIIIFDLSEVLVQGICGCEEEIARVLGIRCSDVYQGLRIPMLGELFRGRVSEKEYLKEVIITNGWQMPESHLASALRKNFRIRVPGSAEIVNSLWGKQYELVLHSDHAREWIAYISRVHSLLRKFRRCFFSFELGSTKESFQTYQCVVRCLGVQSRECIYIDDVIENAKRAEGVGMRSIHFKNANQLKCDLATFGITV